MDNATNTTRENKGADEPRHAGAQNPPLQKAERVAEEMGKEVEHYVDSAKEYWDDLADEVKQKGYIAKEGLKKARRYTDEYAHENPWRLISIAAGVGALAALLLGSSHHRCCRD